MAGLYDRAQGQEGDLADPTHLMSSPKSGGGGGGGGGGLGGGDQGDQGDRRSLKSLDALETSQLLHSEFGLDAAKFGLGGVGGAQLIYYTDDDLREAGIAAREVRTRLLQGVRRFQTEGVAVGLLAGDAAGAPGGAVTRVARLAGSGGSGRRTRGVLSEAAGLVRPGKQTG